MNPKYEVIQDVRAQVKFLEELDKLEKKRHEEQEREMLLRAAKVCFSTILVSSQDFLTCIILLLCQYYVKTNRVDQN